MAAKVTVEAPIEVNVAGDRGALLSATFQRAAAWSRCSVAQAKVTAMDEVCVWSCPSRGCGRFCRAGVFKTAG